MSFQNKGFWMTKATGCLQDGEIPFDHSSRMEPKRSNQWFMDGTEAELLPSKKQAVEVSNLSFSGLLNSNISPWGNGTSFQSVTGQFTERLFDPETARTINYDERNITAVDAANINSRRKEIEDPFGSESSFGLSISHTLEDPRSGLSYGGIRKVKISQVKDAENFMSASIGPAYARGDDNSISAPNNFGKADDNSISMGLSFGRGNTNVISMGDIYNRADSNFISMGLPYNKGEDSTASIGHTYKENDAMSISQSFGKGDTCIMNIGETFNKEGEHAVSVGNNFMENNNAISIGQSFGKVDDGITSMSQTFGKGDSSALMVNNAYKLDDNSMPMGLTFSKFERSTSSIGHSFGKGESNIISFGGYQDDEDSSGRIICSYDLLMGQSSSQRSEALTEKDLVESSVDAIVGAANIITCTNETVSKKKEDKASKKVPPNSFPSNVRSLLSTGMLDGVPVKYMAWSREKELRGIIQGSGYLCGCQSCNYNKAINAYEFERHAGCKTKHPNNHIYFENGKTIYGIVQELRNTPQNLLFEVIQTITGSPINQKSFRLWKESFLAATRELQRIYGKDEAKQLL